MKKLLNNQAGVSHLIAIAAFVLVFGGVIAVAYSRVQDRNSSDSSEIVLTNEDENESVDMNEEQEDPLADIDDGAEPTEE